jgi:4'-phosphopantetheinyl transferase
MPLILSERLNGQSSLGIWRLDESIPELRSLATLDGEEEEYYNSFGNERRKKQWLGYRIILQRLLERGHVRISYDEHGKPSVPGDTCHFSVSHSGDYSAAITSFLTPVGIDIERIRDRIERVTDRFLTEKELSWMNRTYRLEQLHICWGAKESLYKLNGKSNVDFKTDMELEQFDYLCIGKGSFNATMNLPEGKRDFTIQYRKIEDYMLVWAMKNDK